MAAVCAQTSVWSSAWYDAAVVYVPVVTVTVTLRLAPEPESTTNAKVVAAEFTAAPPARPVVTLDTRAAWAPKLPLRSCSLPNDVVFATWSISLRSCTISFWAACRAVVSLAPVLADSITRSRMRCSIDCTDDSAPSAVCTTEMPFCALAVACWRPETCDFRPSLITRPDASSEALLIR